jgi:ElaB/YqjD/DUF883 family membrane-anchored ribosome-binding protein
LTSSPALQERADIDYVERKMNMDRTTPLSTTPSNSNPKIENVAQTAHKVVDTVADKTTAQVDRLSSTAHRAVDKTAGAASQAAGWASSLPDQAMEVQTRLTESVCTSIRARPIATVAGALVVGYLLGRLARL